ncbi:hypothetical protein GDO86_012280 [Hymenochirus boettgeri]|uniref:TIR domain-containing protein n=1 Tax=Hymenochirus boettgeri TaxID=247094 RepID=A0A8T2ISB7_9PIPI|nr:hypothetical protein GDO86_012280 [Hymenochirus boettgeri]
MSIIGVISLSYAQVNASVNFGIWFFAQVTGYGFRDCIQSFENKYSCNCIYGGLRDIKRVVSDLPKDLKYLNVSYNYITVLNEGSFENLPYLLTLRLHHNGILHIDRGAFDNLTFLEELNLSFNNISSLPKDVFRGLSNLTSLYLNQNFLSSIDPEAFSPLINMQTLNLSSNNLQDFEKIVQCIQPLQKLEVLMICSNQISSLNQSLRLPSTLKYLYLCKNHLTSLDCSEDFFLNVRKLELSYNNIFTSSLQKFNLSKVYNLNLGFNENFDILAFIKNSSVRPNRIDYSGLKLNNSIKLKTLCESVHDLDRLTLLSNEIKFLESQCLTKCRPRKTLDLSRNRLKGVGCLEFLDNATISTLIVEHNLLKLLKNCKQSKLFPNLDTISFRYNRIYLVKANAFQFSPNLKQLKLNINNIVFMEREALSGLRNLKELRLDNNLLTDLYESSFLDLTELQILNLRNNMLSVIFPNAFHSLKNLKILDLGGNKIGKLEADSFFGLHNLTKLYLDRNHIKTITGYIFSHVESTLFVLDLGSNQLRFSTSKQRFSPFRNLSKLYDLKLQGQQPYGLTVIPQGFFNGLRSLRALYLTNNRLTSLSANLFDELSKLKYLSLAENCNGIQDLPPGIFKNINNLTELNLENICLQDIKPEVFSTLPNLKKLQLTKNVLKHINVKVLDNMTNLKYLDLRKCPLTCSCNNAELQRWIRKAQVQVVHPYNLTCPGHQKSYFHNFDTHVCDHEIKLNLFCSTFPSILLFLFIPIVYSKFYWQIKYNYFLFIVWLHERWKSDKELYKYDAFVSYNTCDELWVYKVMLPILEDSSLNLCLHHRDFQLGRDIIDNIVDSIHNSRKTICIVSRSYLQSEWCSLEMQLASYKLFDEMRDVLVLILLEDIPDRELSTYHRMRKVMLKKTYITWPHEPEAQNLFWAKVIEAVTGTRSSVVAEADTWGDEGLLLMK